MSETTITWGRRLREDAAKEFAEIRNQIIYSRGWRFMKRRVVWPFEEWLLDWIESAEPAVQADLRFIAQDEDGDILMPRGFRDGEPWWQGYWRWWRPDHWPAYIRSRRARTYVMVERCSW